MTAFLAAIGDIAATAAPALAAPSQTGLASGAILGALAAGGAFMAAGAALRSSGAAWCGLLMIVSAGVLQFFALGFAPPPGESAALVMRALFVGSALVFIATALRAPRSSPLFSGALFAGALALAGISGMNLALGGDATPVIRTAVAAAGAVGVGVALIGALRGDFAARLILPGAALVAAAPFAAAAGPLASSALFSIGVLSASIAALVVALSPQRRGGLPVSEALHMHGPEEPHTEHCYKQEPCVSDNKLATILDYSGVAVWDWTPRFTDQTERFARLMGAGNDGAFTPDAMRDFVAESDREKLERRIFGAGSGDGCFDEVVMLADGRAMRLRGARAVDDLGRLERIVMFAEDAPKSPSVFASQKPDADRLKDPALAAAAATLTGAAAKAARASAHGPIVKAIEAGELEAAFQPIVSLADRKVKGVETLLRWPAAEARGETMGAEAIVAAAEAAGKGGAVARLMLDAAASRVAEEIRKGDKSYFAAFNVSASQLAEKDFVGAVREAIERRKLPAKSLILEVTEAEKLADTPRMAETLRALTAAGAALAYDDFGSGFSSLANLHRYAFDYLKIDKSFIDGVDADPAKRKIVAALAGLGRDLGLSIIAEGVETEKAAGIVGEIGCAYGQGYHLGRPKLDKKAEARAPEKPAALLAPANDEKPADAHAGDHGHLNLAEDAPAAAAQAPRRLGGLFRKRSR